MIGNIWSKAWFDKLTEIIKESGWTVHWYGRGSSCGWLDTNPDKLGKCNIIEKGFLAEDSLATALKRYPFTIVPTGTGEADDSHQGVTLLSLPTRMPFILAAACTPMLVIGTPKSCSARFISRFGVGMSIGYDKTEFAQAVERLSDASFQSKCRDNAVSSANIFSNTDLADWMWASCARQSPVSDRFEKPFRRQPGTLVNYYESPAPRDLYGDFQLVYQSLHRIARYGYEPDFVIDVGASSGVWSDAVNRVFPNARFILIEPLPDRYPKWFHEKHPKFEWVAAAASNESGKASFQVSSDIYGSSLLQPNDNREYTSLEVPIVTLDSIYTQKQIRGRGIVKIDVQFAEHLVIDGSTELLKLIDFVILELTIERSIPTAKTFLEMVTHMSSLGFRYFDDTGEWRNPINGMLEQKDVLFVREDRASEILNS
jgi:FkbM family methyltransferase